MLQGGVSSGSAGGGAGLLSAGLGAALGPVGGLLGSLGGLFGGTPKTAQNIAPAPNWMPFQNSAQLPNSPMGAMNLPTSSILPGMSAPMVGQGYHPSSTMASAPASTMPMIGGLSNGSGGGGNSSPLAPSQQLPFAQQQPTVSAPSSSPPISPLYTPQGALQGYVSNQPQQAMPMQTANEQNPFQRAVTQGAGAIGQAAQPFVDTLGQVFGGQPAEAQAPAQASVPPPPPVPTGGYLASPPGQFGQPQPNIKPTFADALQTRMDKQAAAVDMFMRQASKQLGAQNVEAANIANGARLVTNGYATNQVALFDKMVQSGKVTATDIDNGIKTVGKNAAKAWEVPLTAADKLSADSAKAVKAANSYDQMLQNNMQAMNNLQNPEHYAQMLNAQVDAEEAMIGQDSPFVKGTKQYSRGQMRLARASRIAGAINAANQQEIENRSKQNQQLMAASKQLRDIAQQNVNASVAVRAARAQDIAAAQKSYLDGAGLIMKNVGMQMGARAADISNYLEAIKQQLDNVYSERQTSIGFVNAGLNQGKEAYGANLDAYKISQDGLFKDAVTRTAATNAYAQALNAITNASKAGNGLGLQPNIQGLNQMFPEQAGLIDATP